MIKTISIPQMSVPKPFRIEKFWGINTSASGTQIKDNESPDMLNMVIDELGAIEKRTGYDKVYANSLGAGKINGLFFFKRVDGSIIKLIAHTTKLYTQSGNAQPVEIYSGLANNKVRFFTMSDKCYICDGTNFLRYDGTTIVTVESVAYLPTLTVGRLATGGGTLYEAINLLQPGFKDSFSANGSATTYQLSQTSLDVTAVTAVVNGSNMSEGSGFTVNRAAGTVTFSVAPTTGTNNVIITAYKTVAGNAAKVKTCRMNPILFGGTNDTRVFFGNSPTLPNYLWRSGLYDPTYWPDNTYAKIGNDSSQIMGCTKQYDQMTVHKDDSKYTMSFELNTSGVATFPVKPLNDTNGTISMDSLQIIENSPFSLSRYGVYMTNAGVVREEKNVDHMSNEIDGLLLNETNLQNTISVDYDNKYILCVNNKAYVCDYRHKIYDPETQRMKFVWYPWDNISASCFAVGDDGYLYFGSNTTGLIYKFKKKTDTKPYNDDGQAINAYWKSKLVDFGVAHKLKLVEKTYAIIKPASRTSVDMYYMTNANPETFLANKKMSIFSFVNLDFNNFSFLTSGFPQPIVAKVKAKKILYYQLIFKNNKVDESMGISSAVIEYLFQSNVK